ncbi:MAG: hypothetical protein WBD30_09555 [Bacteroidota bacterium]
MENVDQSPRPVRAAGSKKRRLRINIFVIIGIVALVSAALVVYFLVRPDLSDRIVIPFIAHQKPAVDPHLPSSHALSNKLDEVQFDGLFNLSANPSGVIYEDGLGELIGMDEENVVTVRLEKEKRWHDSYTVTIDDDEVTVGRGPDHTFLARDLAFTLRRIQALGSLSPDYILVSQAIEPLAFEGPDEDNMIRFQFRGDRIWTEADIKEILSFKILPDNSPMNAITYTVGTASYLALPSVEGVLHYHRTPDGGATIARIVLAPFIDNSTYTTEIRNSSINVLLETPYGSLSPILEDEERYFTKSNISTTFFGVFFNTQRLSREQRVELRRLLESKAITERFYKVNTPQQRHIVDYKGNRDNYLDYVNHSVFPSTTYFVEEEVVEPVLDASGPDLSILPDTVRIRASVNHGFREEITDLLAILNDPVVTRNRVQALVVQNAQIVAGNYDAVLVPITGYRSNFLFDLYDIFLREPNLETYKINLVVGTNTDGEPQIHPSSFQANRNFFRLEAHAGSVERDDIHLFLQYLYGFMSTRQVGDRQEYARRIDQKEHEMALGAWLFSLPSLAYFSTQFDSTSIDLYGVASQLSTIEKWRENPEP